MNDAKYIGLDVHQATISATVSGFHWKAGDGVHPGNESSNDSAVYSRTARQFACDLRRRHLCGMVARSAQAPCHASAGL